MKSTKTLQASTILLVVGPLAGAFTPCLAQTPAIEGTQSAIAGGYHYEFTVDNTGGLNEVAIISINAPFGDLLIGPSLTTPAGFLGSYDGGLGFVDFLGDTGSFAPGSITSGFGFDSAGAPPQFFTTFTTLDVAGAVSDGIISYRTVPDMGSSLLPACLGMFALALVQQKCSATLQTRGA